MSSRLLGFIFQLDLFIFAGIAEGNSRPTKMLQVRYIGESSLQRMPILGFGSLVKKLPHGLVNPDQLRECIGEERLQKTGVIIPQDLSEKK